MSEQSKATKKYLAAINNVFPIAESSVNETDEKIIINVKLQNGYNWQSRFNKPEDFRAHWKDKVRDRLALICDSVAFKGYSVAFKGL